MLLSIRSADCQILPKQLFKSIIRFKPEIKLLCGENIISMHFLHVKIFNDDKIRILLLLDIYIHRDDT